MCSHRALRGHCCGFDTAVRWVPRTKSVQATLVKATGKLQHRLATAGGSASGGALNEFGEVLPENERGAAAECDED